ncbi:sigma-70 family RNA polymerase sigma factor [Chitinophagaceae bacterium 26-R-25]|nr:sigma-70 family RNA polymerase sigma factor [Chitinophagaceae bacterium 26-R-25]
MMDKYLIEGIQENNQTIFSTVFKQYHAKLYFYFLEKSGSSITSSELVQTTFIKCWNHRHGLNLEMALSAQLFRIAKTTFIDHLREKARERIVSIEVESINEDLTDPIADIHPLLDEVEASLNKISPQRSTIVKFRLEGFSNQEIADQLGISKKTVENQLNKAVKEIRSLVHSTADLSFPLFLFCLLYTETITHSLGGAC